MHWFSILKTPSMFVVQIINSICNSWQTYIVQTMHLRWETLILRPCTVCETLSHLRDYGKFYINYMHHVWMIAESLHVRYINIHWRHLYKCRYRNVKHENIKAVNKEQKNCGRNFIDESHKTRIHKAACTPQATSNLMEAWRQLVTGSGRVQLVKFNFMQMTSDFQERQPMRVKQWCSRHPSFGKHIYNYSCY